MQTQVLSSFHLQKIDLVNVDELRIRGKTEEVIGLLRCLLYLYGPAPGKKRMIGPDSAEIAYYDGKLQEKVTESIQSVPRRRI